MVSQARGREARVFVERKQTTPKPPASGVARAKSEFCEAQTHTHTHRHVCVSATENVVQRVNYPNVGQMCAVMCKVRQYTT